MIRSFIPAFIFFIITVVLLTLPGSAFPSENWMGDIQFDKSIHIGLFAALTFLVCWGFYCRVADPLKTQGKTLAAPDKKRLTRSFVFAAIASLVYGIIMEYVQRDFIPNRSFDSGDIIADGVGAFGGMLFGWFRYTKK